MMSEGSRVHDAPVVFQVSGEFKERCKLTYTGPKQATAKSRRMVSVQVEQSKLSGSDLTQLKGLVEAGQLYRIRVQSNVNDPNSPKVLHANACLLREGQGLGVALSEGEGSIPKPR